MDLLKELASVLAAGVMVVSGALKEAAPQHDADGLLFLVNRQYMISDAFEPADLREAQVPGQVRQMRDEAAAALEEMFAACKEETGVTLISVSGYRSYSRQNNIYQRKLRSVKKNVEKAQEYVAPPGASEHQLGLAMDIGQRNKIHLEVSFRDTEGGKWCRENCWRFGFILRYDEPWEAVTGYKYEPWHFRYVGKELAKEIHDANIPLETWLIGYRTDELKKLVSAGKAPQPATPGDLAATPNDRCAQNAPKSAAKGLPHFFASFPRLSKYSCRVSHALSKLPPMATSFVTASTTAYIAPWNGLHSIRYGSSP